MAIRGMQSLSALLFLIWLGGVTNLQAQEEILAEASVGQGPVAVAINPIAGQAFVLNQLSKDVYVIDLKSHNPVAKYLVGGSPESLAVNPQTNSIVVVGLDGAATIIDHATGRIVGVVPVGKAPSRVAIDVEQNAALVTNFNGSNMVVLDLATRMVTRTIALKNGPLGIAVLEGQRRALVACQYDMEILQVDLVKGEVAQSLVLGRYLSEVAANQATGEAVVGNPSNNGILSIYDPSANRVTATLAVGRGPLSVAVYPKKNVALAAEFDSGSLTLVDMAKGAVIRTVKVGKGPRGVAVHPHTGIVAVVDMLEDKVVFLDLSALLAAAGL